MNPEELEARVRTLEDIQQIDRLQKIYGYYLDNGMMDKVVDLFSDDAESVEIGDRGQFRGKEGVRRFFWEYLGRGGKPRDPGTMAIHMQHQGVVDVDPGGRTARGRWYCTMLQARPIEEGGPTRSILGHGVYENEFVREDGKWKFKKIFYSLHFRSPLAEGWATTPVTNESKGHYPVKPDAMPTAYHPYPELGFVPFHWKHPVTGE
jgi:hypothetical protein